jgi:hypothetical protein
MECKKHGATVVDPGGTPKIFATEIIAIDYGEGYAQVTCAQGQMFGQTTVQEREVTGRVIFTQQAWEALLAMALARAAAAEEKRTQRHH